MLLVQVIKKLYRWLLYRKLVNMLQNIENEKRKSFKQLLRELSKKTIANESDMQLNYSKLQNIYFSGISAGERFRHFYSDIYIVLSKIKKTGEGDLETLGMNIRSLRENFLDYNHDMNDVLTKLYDHVSLDIARLNNLDMMNRPEEIIPAINKLNNKYKNVSLDLDDAKKQQDKLGNKINDAKKQQDKLGKKINDAKKQQDKLGKEIKNQQKYYITILGIFASIMITSVGSFIYSNTLFTNMVKINCLSLIPGCLVLGFVFYNIVICMYRFISIINGMDSHKKSIQNNELILSVNLIFSVLIIVSIMINIIVKNNIE